MDEFHSKWGFLQCVGAIDGSHIPIIGPNVNPVNYFNSKGYQSVILHAGIGGPHVLEIYVGWPGSVHDA